MKLIQVKQFNQEATARYNKAVDSFEPNRGDGFPFLPIYIFETEEGKERQRGYVATENDKHCFGITREEAIANFNGI